MKKKKLKGEAKLIKEMICALSQPSPNPLANTNVTCPVEQDNELGTLEKKLQESNRISALRVQNADYKEIQREFEMKQLRQLLKSLSGRVDRLEKQQEKMLLKSDCIHKLKKRVRNQDKSLKQIEYILYSIISSKGKLPPGTSIKKIYKICKYKNDQAFLDLLGKSM